MSLLNMVIQKLIYTRYFWICTQIPISGKSSTPFTIEKAMQEQFCLPQKTTAPHLRVMTSLHHHSKSQHHQHLHSKCLHHSKTPPPQIVLKIKMTMTFGVLNFMFGNVLVWARSMLWLGSHSRADRHPQSINAQSRLVKSNHH